MKYVYVFLALAFSSCIVEKHTPLTQRYRSIKRSVPKTGDSAKAELSVFVIPTQNVTLDSARIKTFFDLKGAGQAAITQAFKEKNPDGQSRLSDLLNTKFQTPDDPQVLDLRTEDLTIVYSVSQKDFLAEINNSLSPGDRLEKIKITLSLDDKDKSRVQFKKWDKFATQYGQFNIAGVTFTQAKELNISPSIPIAGVAASLGSFDNKTSLQETDSLQKRFIALTGIMSKDKLIIQQDGNSTIDLQGNTSASISVFFPQVMPVDYTVFQQLRDKKGAYQNPEDIQFSLLHVTYPSLPPNSDISATVSMEYTLRHIEVNAQTFTESDDDIYYYYGTTTPYKIEHFITRDDVIPIRYGVTRDDQRLGLFDPIANVYHELIFKDSYQAADFIAWLDHLLSSLPEKSKSEKIKIGDAWLTASFDVTQHTFPRTATYLTKEDRKILKIVADK